MAKATKKVLLKGVKTPKGNFIVDLDVNGVRLTGSAATLSEAILAIPKFQPKTKGTIYVSKINDKGDKVTSKPLPLQIPMLNRLFYPGMTGEVNRTVLEKRYKFFAPTE